MAVGLLFRSYCWANATHTTTIPTPPPPPQKKKKNTHQKTKNKKQKTKQNKKKQTKKQQNVHTHIRESVPDIEQPSSRGPVSALQWNQSCPQTYFSICTSQCIVWQFSNITMLLTYSYCCKPPIHCDTMLCTVSYLSLPLSLYIYTQGYETWPHVPGFAECTNVSCRFT